ncbi:MAG TPA: HNH endonuclease signature motif containing protein [Polyangiales bacterium]|nr:HNH endonuclease signature motif containing protein [Polyangiales bacterium]
MLPAAQAATAQSSEHALPSISVPVQGEALPADPVPAATAAVQSDVRAGDPVRGLQVMAFGEPSLPRAPDPSSIVPLRAGRYKVQFTATQSLVDMFSEARELFRNQLPTDDLAGIVERALALLIADRKKQRFALTSKPRAPRLSETDTTTGKAGPAVPSVHAEHQPSKPSTSHIAHVLSEAHADDARPTTPAGCAERQPAKPNTRHIAYALRRQVYARDAGRCCFVSSDGTRCGARGNLEFHHIIPFARGGEATLENICLMCRAHNALIAERDYNREFVKRRIAVRGAAAPRVRAQNNDGSYDSADARVQVQERGGFYDSAGVREKTTPLPRKHR